jgi:hypothetical protein
MKGLTGAARMREKMMNRARLCGEAPNCHPQMMMVATSAEIWHEQIAALQCKLRSRT